VPWVNGESVPHWTEDVYCEHKFRQFNNWYGVRGKQYKYAVYYGEKGGPVECLYDLKKDPTELVNLAENPEYAPALTAMRSRLDAYLKTFLEVDPSPAVKTTAPAAGSPERLTGGVVSFSGNQAEKLADVPKLTAQNKVTWRMEVNIDPACAPGAVLMGNRKTPNQKTTFFKITPSKGVQLFRKGKPLVKMDAELPRDRWVAVEVVKDGVDFTLTVDGEKQASAKLVGSAEVTAMPCYLGGDPAADEFAICLIRNAAVDVQ